VFADGVGVSTFKMGRRRFDVSGSGESSWRKFGAGSCADGLKRNEKGSAGDGRFEDSEVIAELARDTRAEKGTEDKMGDVSRVLFTVARARSKRDRGCAVSSVSSGIVAASASGVAGVIGLGWVSIGCWELDATTAAGFLAYFPAAFLGCKLDRRLISEAAKGNHRQSSFEENRRGRGNL
jgi:hypothetical protein